MKYHLSFLYTLFLIIVIGLIGVGCTVTSPAPTVTTEFATFLSVIPTALSTPTPTATPPLPSTTPLPTERPATFTPTPTLEPTSTETAVPIPTAPGASVMEQVVWLFETNNGCQLPCWWGITPGQTNWTTVASFLTIFDQNIFEDLSVPEFANYEELAYYEASIPVPSDIFKMDITFLVQDNRVVWIFADAAIHTSPNYLTSYLLSNFLLVYGEPSEVWLFTYSSAFEAGSLPFITVLFYPHQGIVALYSDNGVQQGSIIQGCPQTKPTSHLILNIPESNLTFKQTIGSTSLFEGDYLSLAEATSMDVATFYETFKKPDNTICLETPANLWEP